MDRLSTPWAKVRASHLLSWWCTVAEDLGMAGDGPMEQGTMALEPHTNRDLDDPVFMKENVRLGLFQTQILVQGQTAHW